MKTLIVIDNLHVGGVASSLYNYLKYATKIMDCSLLVFNEDSINKAEIPSNVTILKTPKILHLLGKNRKELLHESKIMAVCKGILITLCKLTNGEAARKVLFPFLKKTEEYDLAISYAQDDSWKSISKGCNDYLIKKVNAKYKAVIVHCDYQNFGGYSPKQEKIFSSFDGILCVSESCKQSFTKCFPQLSEKTFACENFTNVDRVQQLSENSVEYPTECVNFVSVCRLSVVKGLERTVCAFKSLYDEGYRDFSWTIVGDGPEYANINKQISEFGLQDKLVLVGNKNNPYPYIKNASVFLLPSLHEAAPMVYGESAALGVPILTTNTCSANEIVKERNWGMVVENSDSGVENGLRTILSGKADLKKYAVSNNNINEVAEAQFKRFVYMVKQTI